MTTLPTPPSCQDPAAQLTPPFMAQWTEMFKQMHDAAVAQQKAAAGASSVDDSTPGHSPCPSLAYLPGLLAAAAPFMATQQVQHELQKQMEAIFLGSNGMGAPANRQ